MKGKTLTAYEADFYGWTQQQARLLRSGAMAEVDCENLAEEIEALGRSERREIESRLVVLLTHLIKWGYQFERRSRSWANTIRTQRHDLESVLSDSPSLRTFAQTDAMKGAFPRALEQASEKMGLIRPLTDFNVRTFESAMTFEIEL